MMKFQRNKWMHPMSLIVVALLVVAFWIPTASARDWDGGGDETDWQDPVNWDGDVEPSGTDVAALPDVTAGVRSVTVTGTPSTVKTVAMTQSTAGATNMLTVTGLLVLNATPSVTFFNQTLSAPVSSLVVNLESGGLIRYDQVLSSSTYTVDVKNRGTFNLNGGELQYNNNRRYAKYFYNYGILNSTGGKILGKGTSDGNNSEAMIFFNKPGGEVHLKSGTTMYGIYYAGNRTIVQIQNDGLITVSTGAVLKCNNRWTQNTSAYLPLEIYNNASGVLTVGDTNSSGVADILFTNEDGGSNNIDNWPYRFFNYGAADFYGESRMLGRPATEHLRNYAVYNYVSGTLNLHGNTNGIQIGSDQSGASVSLLVQNYGEMNVKVFSGAETGLSLLGNTLAQQSVYIWNRATGVWTVDPDAVLRVQAKRPMDICRFINAESATLTLGAEGQTAKGGTLEFALTATGGSGAPYFENRTNSTVILHGTSAIERSPDFAVVSGEAAFLFTNTLGGTNDLRDTSRIGNTSRDMVFVNDGTLFKTNAGTAVIASAAGGSFTNSGTMVIGGGGALDIQCPAATLTATTDLTFDFGDGAPLLHVTGTLNIEGGTLHVTGENTEVYTLITYPSGALTGTFGTVDSQMQVFYTDTAIQIRPTGTTIILQ